MKNDFKSQQLSRFRKVFVEAHEMAFYFFIVIAYGLMHSFLVLTKVVAWWKGKFAQNYKVLKGINW